MNITKLEPEERVYYAFYIARKKSMYFSELRRIVGMSISSLQNVLAKMEKNNEIEKRKERANTFYCLKNKELVGLNFSKLDILRINELNLDVRLPIKEFIETIPRQISFILLFGSASRKEEKKGSDVDLLVVLDKFENLKLQEEYEKEVKKKINEAKKKVDAKSLYSLSILFVNEKEFFERKDYLLGEAKKGFCIFNQLRYYKEIPEIEK